MCRELSQNISGDGKRMSTYRIYLDSRERKSGTATDFEYALPYTLSIRERSLAMVDVVVVPNSIKTVGAKNNMIYVRETVTVGKHCRGGNSLSNNSRGLLHSGNAQGSHSGHA